MKTPLRIGIAGYAVVGKGRRRVIDADPDVERAAVCDQKMPGRGKFPDGVRAGRSVERKSERAARCVAPARAAAEAPG